MKRKNKNGFTLIELLVVVSIIGILVVTIAGSFTNSHRRSRDTARKTELRSLSDALSMYFADKGEFPESEYMNNLILNQGEFADNSNPNNKVVYMKKVPKEETSGVRQIYYETSVSKKSFRLFTNLENEDDIDCVDSEVCNNLDYDVSSGCCYVVTSPNASLDSLP